MKSKVNHWDDMYEMPLEKVPWEIQNPPAELKDLIDKKIIKGVTALDIGCGTGNYAIYLARNGFQVIGVDFSEKALEIARKNSKKLRLSIKFINADITELRHTLKDHQFDFILDYSILHHLPLSKTKSYADQFHHLLKKGGKLLLVCYSDKDEYAHGSSSARGKYGNKMYYRTAQEIRQAYKKLKEISYKESHLGKRRQHIAHSFTFERI